MPHQNIHQPSMLERAMGGGISLVVHGIIFAIFALSTGTETESQAAEPSNTIFCRYIDNGQLSQFDVRAKNWQEAEEIVCGAHLRDVRLPPLLAEGARLIFDGDNHPLLRAQRESCSCSGEERVPILQDIGIIEAPRLGAETRRAAMPRIINTPPPASENVVTTNKTKNKPDQKKREKTAQKPKTPTLDDILNSAQKFDDARPASEKDPGGSADGSRLSKSATGQGDPYLQKIKAKLDNTMNAPASIPKSQLQKLSAKITIKIFDNGTISNWDFVKKSGNPAFDRMIEMTIKQFTISGSMRFAPPPQTWRLRTIPIRVDGRDIR